MTVEAPRTLGEQPRDPVQEARGSFNRELLGREYRTGVLLSRTLQLQNVLLQSPLSPERIYHELAVVAGQGADRAEIYEDAETASTFRELQTGFQLTYETFRPGLEAATRATQPTRTESLPPMTSAKGETGQLQPRPQPSPVAPANPGEQIAQQADIQPKEETVGSFIRQKRTDAGLSQVGLGKAAGNMPHAVISHIERGTLPSDPEKLAQLATALGLNEEDTQKLMDLYNKQTGKSQEPPQQ